MMDRILWWLLPERIYRKLRDHCEICGGMRRGVRGNENVVQSGGERVVMCDYCSLDEWKQPGFWRLQPKGCFPPCGLCYAGQCAAVPRSTADGDSEHG